MTSNLINSWQKEREKVEVDTDFILLGLAWTATAAVKLRCLLPGGKAMTNVVSVLKSRDITLPTKGHSQSYCFSSSFVWMEKESWALKN